MMKKLSLAILLASIFTIAACSGPVDEGPGWIEIYNDSTDTYILEVYVSPYSSDVWGSNVLPVADLYTDESVEYEIDCNVDFYWDVQAVDDLGYTCTVYDIYVCDPAYDYYVTVYMDDLCWE